ncbi:unnamed protein product [Chilo suppressalis]|uniref:Uncharacterized protein n=1 Tax=Chilo suppressalis TaxID=168631 RepID=A0ABN8B7T1_CHISP|nr:unnamed protein product [Chilo suppressalis]
MLKQLGNAISHPLEDSDILPYSRVRKFDAKTKIPRSVIVKLASARIRDGVLAAVVKFSKAHPKEKLNSDHLRYGGDASVVYVTKHLSPHMKGLHAETRKLAREKGFKHTIEVEILTGCGVGEAVFIPRIPLIPHNFPFEFKCVQFPVSVCFAMIINKSQGQTLRAEGVDLRASCFSHAHALAESSAGRTTSSTRAPLSAEAKYYAPRSDWARGVTSRCIGPMGGSAFVAGRSPRRRAFARAVCRCRLPPRPATTRLARILVVGVAPCSPRVCRRTQCAVCECFSSRSSVSVTENPVTCRGGC